MERQKIMQVFKLLDLENEEKIDGKINHLKVLIFLELTLKYILRQLILEY